MVIIDVGGPPTVQIISYPSHLAQIKCPAHRPHKTAWRLPPLTIPPPILFVFLALWGREVQAAEADSPAEIVLGMSTVLTGNHGNLSKEVKRGSVAGLERPNHNGWVNGRKLRLISLDDGYEPTRTGPNMRQLIEKDNVLAVIGYVGTPTAIVYVRLAMR